MVFGLKQVRLNQAFDEVETDPLSFWIQLHNLPLHCFRQSIVRSPENEIGEVQEICLGDEEGIPYEDIVRLKIIINIQNPFIPAIRLRRDNRWMYIKYEKLPPICKFCGIINHSEDECISSFNIANVPSHLRAWAEMLVPGTEKAPVHFPFGGWMGCPRFRRESCRTWGKVSFRLGGGRMKKGEDIESTGSFHTESTQQGRGKEKNENVDRRPRGWMDEKESHYGCKPQGRPSEKR